MSFFDRIQENSPENPPVKSGSTFFDRVSSIQPQQEQTVSQVKAPTINNLSFNTTPNITAQSTPAFAPTGTPNLNPIALFKPRSEPVEVRRVFEKTPVKTKAPPIVTGLAGLGRDIVEMIPKGLATLYGESKYKTTGKESIPIGIDARRIGFDEQNYTTAVKEIADRVDKGESPWGASIGVASEKALDVIVVGQILKSVANVSTKLLKKGGDTALIEAWNILGKPQTMEDAKVAFRKKAFEFHPDLGGSPEQFSLVKNAFNIIEEKGIPSTASALKSNVARYTEVASRETDLGKGFFGRISKPNITPQPVKQEVNKISGFLPGQREVPGQAPAFGLSTRKVENVPAVSKYKNADEFESSIKQKADKVFQLSGNSIKDISIIGSTAVGKTVPNDLDILITPTKPRPPMTSDNVNSNIEFNNVLKKELQEFFPDKNIHITVSEYDPTRGGKISLTDLYNKTKETELEKGLFKPEVSQNKTLAESNIQAPTTVPETPKKLIVKRESKPLPEELQKKATEVEIKKQTLETSPFKSKDNRLLFDREGRVRELGNIKSPTLIRKLEDRMAESGITDPAEFSAGVEKYFKQKNDLKVLETELKTAVKEVRSEETLTKMRDKLEKHQEKMVDFAEKYPKLASLITNLSEEATFGAKKGYKLGVEVATKETKDSLISSFRQKNFDVENAKKKITEYATDKLPVSERGKLMTLIRDAKTTKDVVKAFSRIDKKVQEIAVKTAIRELKDVVMKLSTSNAVSADYRSKIKEIIDSYELDGHTKATIEKLKATQEYINKQSLAGENVEIPQRLVDKLKILERTPKSELTLDQIKGLQSEVELLGKLGETKWASKQALYDAEKELRKQELLKSTSSINSKEFKNIGLEKDPPKYIQSYIKARNYLQKTRIGLTPIEGLADITGMQPMKRVMDMNFGNYLTHNDAVTKQWYNLTKDFTDENFKKIGAYAISKQSGGIERLANNGITQAQIDKLELTPAEKKAYDFVRTTFDNEFPAVKKYAMDVYNKDVGEVKNYVSFMSDNDAMNELEIYDRFGTPPDFPSKTKTVEQGFTKSRAEIAKNKLELNIDKIFRRHIDDVAYMLNTGRDIKQYFEIINSPEMRQKLGDVGSLAWLQYLDLMARKGGSEGAKRIAILDTIRQNLAGGVLAFRLGSAVIQLTSFADALGTIGTEWAMKGASSIATSKQWRNFVMDNFPEVKKAIGDDLAFREFGEGFLQKATRIGLTPLQAMDGLMRSMSVAGAYQKLAKEKGIIIDLTKPNKDLIQEATRLMRQSQGSSFFKDQPLSITSNFGLTDNKSLNKTLLTFQSFMLSRWDNIQRQIWRLGIKEKNYKKASMSFLYMVLVASAMEEGLRRGVNSVLDTGTGLITGKENASPTGSFIGNSGMNIVQAIPLAGQLASSMTYSSNPIPTINTFEQVLKGANSVWGGKELRTKIRGGASLLGATGSLLGIPGSSQGAQILKDLVPPANAKTPEETKYAEKLKKESDVKKEKKTDLMPTYKKVQDLLKNGDKEGANAIVNGLSDADYEIYKSIRTSERTKNSNKLKTLINTDPIEAVKFVREQNKEEQQRLINNLNDEEYNLYNSGKVQSKADSSKSKKLSLLKEAGGVVKSLFTPKVAYAEEMPTQKKYYIRDNPISELDLDEAKAVLYAEISNRTPEKQKLEAQTILNTAFNRQEYYNKIGYRGKKDWTLTDVLQEKNQYQGYAPEGIKNDKGKLVESQYQKYKANKKEELSQQKIDAIDQLLAKVRDGSFINNISDYRFYTHKPDGRIIATKTFKKLFK
jgi:hypothetical protein